MNLTNLLPFENYVLTTKLSRDEVFNRLSDNIEPKKSFRFGLFGSSSTKAYEGEISEYTFRINRIIYYRNSFLPEITGDILSLPGQTQINIKMKLTPLVLIFIIFWLGFVGLFSIGILVNALPHLKQIGQGGFPSRALIPFGAFIFGCLLTSIAFKVESRKSRKFLVTLLEGEEKSNKIQ